MNEPAPMQPSAYQERLWPGIGTLLAFLVIALGLALAFVPLGPIPLVIAVAAILVLYVAVVVMLSPTIALRQGTLQAGRARLPWSMVGTVTALDAGQLRTALGPELDVRAYLCVRGWIRTGARVTVNDPDDPTPYWLISTRHPERLIQAAHSRHTA
jgi:hypothetical protein